MPFTTRGVVVDLLDAEGTLVAPLAYQGKVDYWVVPSGFRTDFASVPQVAMWLFPSLGKYTRAAVLHDWFCKHLAIGDSVVSARDADAIFRRVMREAHVGFCSRWLMWTGVRWGALTNRTRRAGWLRDAPAVFGITALVLLPFVLVLAAVLS